MTATLNDRIATALALIDALPTDPATGRPLPPKTRNRARPAMHGPHGWGWTHYFLCPDDTIVGHKLPGNPTFIAQWAHDNIGPGLIHLGRATPDPRTGTFTFEAWPWPVSSHPTKSHPMTCVCLPEPDGVNDICPVHGEHAECGHCGHPRSDHCQPLTLSGHEDCELCSCLDWIAIGDKPER